MAVTMPSQRTLTILIFLTIFALSTAEVDIIQSAKSAIPSSPKVTNVFDSIRDKIAIDQDSINSILRLSTQKTEDAQKSRSITTTLFAILFPSSKPAINALLATAYISGPPNFLLALCPPNIDPASLSIMVAFAVGGLLGDTFFHLLPEIFLGEDHESQVKLVFLEPNRNLLLGVFIFIGLATFMAMDKALRIATGGAHSHSHAQDEGGDLGNQAQKISEGTKVDETDYRILGEKLATVASNESHEEHRKRLEEKPYNDTFVNGKKTRDVVKEIAEQNAVRKRTNRGTDSAEGKVGHQTRPSNSRKQSEKRAQRETREPQEEKKDEQPTSLIQDTQHMRDINPSVKLAGLLNLIADFTHNITDGLALSTSFYSSPALGATTTMAVFFHEIPHEVGDFALLIQSGFTKRAAMSAQFVTAIGAFLGTIIGILVQEYGSGSGESSTTSTGLFGTSLQWSDTLLPFTAGTFLYVGTVGVIPELLENAQGVTKMQELQRTLMQFGAMALGALIMVVISWN